MCILRFIARKMATYIEQYVEWWENFFEELNPEDYKDWSCEF